jgi:transcription elongation factor Elf1
MSLEDFAKMLSKNPDLVIQLRKRAELDRFKEKYNVERATPFKCPACAALLQSPGSLWIDKDVKSRFVCKKCHTIYQITSEPLSTDELIYNIRLILKGDEKATLDWDKKLTGSKEKAESEQDNGKD